MRAIPFEAVDQAHGALALDDQTGAVGLGALRGVPHVRGKQEDIAFLQVHAFGFAVHPQGQPGVAFDLVEEFFQRVIVIVGAKVRAADDGDDEIRILPDLLVADRRLQKMRVVLYPALEIQRRAVGGHEGLRGGRC
ncbi:hypothetical protein G6F68_017648 [Rhizopus microsporus]|nr:hypothetical protein G6F68_017648 [Rhizopus microsporus]